MMDHKEMMDFFAAERYRQDLSLSQMAEKIGQTSKASVWNWENHQQIPSLAKMIRWARALGLKISLEVESDRTETPSEESGGGST